MTPSSTFQLSGNFSGSAEPSAKRQPEKSLPLNNDTKPSFFSAPLTGWPCNAGTQNSSSGVSSVHLMASVLSSRAGAVGRPGGGEATLDLYHVSRRSTAVF